MIRPTTLCLLVLGVSFVAAAESPWWNADFKRRARLELPVAPSGVVRIDLPAEAKPDEMRVVAGGQLVEQWTPTLEMTDLRSMTPNPQENARFPRLVAAGNGDLLLTYRVGHAHATSDSRIVHG